MLICKFTGEILTNGYYNKETGESFGREYLLQYCNISKVKAKSQKLVCQYCGEEIWPDDIVYYDEVESVYYDDIDCVVKHFGLEEF